MGSSLVSSKWGSAGWWFVLTASVPFSLYVWPFAINDFNTYKILTLTWVAKEYDIAGLNIRDHHIAWQIHSIVALLFIFTGLFQFSPSFRKAYPTTHRRMGYIFLGAAIVQCTTGMVFMIPNSEFGTVGRTVFFLLGVALFVYSYVAVQAARHKNFKVHQQYMIRAAAVGYSFIGMRFWVGVFLAQGVYVWKATEWGAFVSPLTFAIPAEIYIKTSLKGRQKGS